MEFDLRQLQLKIEESSSVENSRKRLNEMFKFFCSESNKEKVKLIFNELRDNFNIDDLEEKEIFFYDEEEFNQAFIPDEFKQYSLGLFKDQYSSSFIGRLIYPVRDVKGDIMGFCGWDPFVQPKYLDSKNYGYNAKRNCLYGMEKLKDYYSSKEPVFIVEGIPCCNYLRSKGFQALALLGSSISKYVIEILKRFEDRCILLPDNDEAGLYVLKSARRKLPKARCYVSIVAKDPDDTRRVNNGMYEEDFLNELKNISNPFQFTKILRILK